MIISVDALPFAVHSHRNGGEGGAEEEIVFFGITKNRLWDRISFVMLNLSKIIHLWKGEIITL